MTTPDITTRLRESKAVQKLRVELEIDVVELPEDEQKECREQLGSEEGDDEFFSPSSYAAADFSEVIEAGFHEEAVREMFAGSNMYVTFENPRVVSASWATPSQIEEGKDNG